MVEPGFETLSYCEMRCKEVVNIIDGRRLGRIVDIIFCALGRGEIKGIVVPFSRRFFFSRAQEVFVPWHCIRKIGEDVILVELVIEPLAREPGRRRRRYDAFEDGRFDRIASVQEKKELAEPKAEKGDGQDGITRPQFSVHAASVPKKRLKAAASDEPVCDRKCEKCMLFDCTNRWKDA
ncbi:MAG: YlmC/YmxH family sporulation protein [Firmicutes bacterium]|nr:YlmC/YmxH family sporulation protein [Bacillota bacterium]